MQAYVELINTVSSFEDYKEMEILIEWAGELSTLEKDRLLILLRRNKTQYRYGEIVYG